MSDTTMVSGTERAILFLMATSVYASMILAAWAMLNASSEFLNTHTVTPRHDPMVALLILTTICAAVFVMFVVAVGGAMSAFLLAAMTTRKLRLDDVFGVLKAIGVCALVALVGPPVLHAALQSLM